MVAARLNRDKLRLLSESRLQEARILLENRLWTGFYYLAGLSVECALKAYLAQGVRQYDFPDKQFVNSLYTHNLKELAKLDATFWVELEAKIESDIKARRNWSTVFLWNNENRYDIVNELQATSLFTAITEADTGAMEWIRRRWQ